MSEKKPKLSEVEIIRRIIAGAAIRYREAAMILGISTRTVRRWVADGILRVRRATRSTIFVDRACIEPFLRDPLPWDEVDAALVFARNARSR